MKLSSTKAQKMADTPLAVVNKDGEVFMLVRVDKKIGSSLKFLVSENGIDFKDSKKKVLIKNLSSQNEKIKICDRFSLSRTPNGYVMTYVREGNKKTKAILVVARSSDLYEWKIMSELPVDEFHHTTVIYDKKRDRFDLYRDGLFIKHQSTSTMTVWKEKPTLLFTSRNDFFDKERLSIIGSIVTKEGNLIVYDASVVEEEYTLLQAGAIIVDKNNPKVILWRSDKPIWQGIVESKKKSKPINPFGIVSVGKSFLLYWTTADKGLIVVKIPALFEDIEEMRYRPKILDRFKGNPIIEPRHDLEWEREATFNPAVVEDDEGIIHLLYRAIGGDGISRIGYAQSKDGKYFSKRSPRPVFVAPLGLGEPERKSYLGPQVYSHLMYTSGGGWGGSEDPRVVRIGDTVYMLYVAFEGWGSMRIALTSISLEDFKAGKWKWKKPRLISPSGVMAKNWLLFPEKINGKYAIIHSIVPRIAIEYIDDIDNFEGEIISPRIEGAPQPGKRGDWAHLIRGAGPPPIKTKEGWLLLYHALEKKETSRYKLGAMILDKHDPSKVLYRSEHPILCPDMHYENNGKPGIVYASGAVVRGDDLFIYYGGADKVVCVATTPIKKFLKYLVSGDASSYELSKA
jgi:predicted GH43/DUF377 family glycosyl hydrolase